ncbi:MAG: beta-lactamase family protein [Verrucomicrobiales bacterium]|nr:beta-lactamase family protein [Verrucomicrobiales bacterium]
MNPSAHSDAVPASPAYTSTIAEGRGEILKELARTDTITHAVSVALLDDRRILWEEAFGLVDKTRSARPDPETLFCIASLSKIVAAVGTMMLVDRGLVVLDDPVTRYLTNFRMTGGEAWRRITVRMLLNHSSGLPGTHLADVLTVVPLAGYAAQLERSMARKRLKHAPGEMAAVVMITNALSIGGISSPTAPWRWRCMPRANGDLSSRVSSCARMAAGYPTAAPRPLTASCSPEGAAIWLCAGRSAWATMKRNCRTAMTCLLANRSQTDTCMCTVRQAQRLRYDQQKTLLEYSRCSRFGGPVQSL